MARKDRLKIIKELEKKKDNTKIICYITSTRPGLYHYMGDDAVRKIYDHLRKMSSREKGDVKIDLFIYSAGGDALVPWKLVNIIREFTNKFEILIPYKAYSAATATAMGANKIWMGPMAELGPVDPKVMNEFNPMNKTTDQTIGINVEDVSSYISFVKDTVGIKHEDELIQALNSLTDKVHPLALGNVNRFLNQSRMMAEKLLRLHMTKKEEHLIPGIIDALTAKLYFHGHPINRKEARTLNLKVYEPTANIEKLMWNLYEEYEKEMLMQKAFRPVDILNRSRNNVVRSDRIKGVYIESEARTDVFVAELEISRIQLPPQATDLDKAKARGKADIIVLTQGWETERT